MSNLTHLRGIKANGGTAKVRCSHWLCTTLHSKKQHVNCILRGIDTSSIMTTHYASRCKLVHDLVTNLGKAGS